MTQHRHDRKRSTPRGATSAERPCYREAHRARSSIIRTAPPLYRMIARRSASIYHTTSQAPKPSIGHCVVGHLRCFLDVHAEEVNLNLTCSNVSDHSSSSSHAPEPYIQTKSSICLDADKAQKRKKTHVRRLKECARIGTSGLKKVEDTTRNRERDG